MVSPYLFQSEMSDVTPKLNNLDKYVRAILVKDIATQLIESKIENDGRAPHGEVDEHPDDAKCACSSILIELCSCIGIVSLVRKVNVI